MRAAPFVLALVLSPLGAAADPIPVHVAAARGRAAQATNSERIAVAEAVAQLLVGAAREVLTATETRARVEALNPSGVSCDGLECITSITLPLHARALVLVRVGRQRDATARVEVRLVNLRGEVLAERAEQDLATSTEELIALARLAAPPIAEALARLDAPREAVSPSPPTVSEPLPTPAPRARPVVAPQRRPGEIAGGVAALVLGVGAMAVGVAGFAGGARVTRDLGENRVEVEEPSALNWAWIAGGAVGLGLGTFLVVDGLRVRPGPTTAWLLPLPGGAAVFAGSTF